MSTTVTTDVIMANAGEFMTAADQAQYFPEYLTALEEVIEIARKGLGDKLDFLTKPILADMSVQELHTRLTDAYNAVDGTLLAMNMQCAGRASSSGIGGRLFEMRESISNIRVAVRAQIPH